MRLVKKEIDVDKIKLELGSDESADSRENHKIIMDQSKAFVDKLKVPLTARDFISLTKLVTDLYDHLLHPNHKLTAIGIAQFIEREIYLKLDKKYLPKHFSDKNAILINFMYKFLY